MSELGEILNWNWGYIFVTLFIVLFLISALSILTGTISSAISGNYFSEIVVWLCYILEILYNYSGIGDVLSSCCISSQEVLFVLKYIGYVPLFLKFVFTGGIELLFNMNNSYYWSVFFKVFVPAVLLGVFTGFIASSVASYIIPIIKGYFCWLCS